MEKIHISYTEDVQIICADGYSPLKEVEHTPFSTREKDEHGKCHPKSTVWKGEEMSTFDFTVQKPSKQSLSQVIKVSIHREI